MSKRSRKNGEQKARILREVLKENLPISNAASQYEVSPNDIYRWEKRLFEAAPNILATQAGRPKDETLLLKKVEELEEKLRKKDRVIAELAEDVLTLKKSLGEI
jgi:transposase